MSQPREVVSCNLLGVISAVLSPSILCLGLGPPDGSSSASEWPLFLGGLSGAPFGALVGVALEASTESCL